MGNKRNTNVVKSLKMTDETSSTGYKPQMIVYEHFNGTGNVFYAANYSDFR